MQRRRNYFVKKKFQLNFLSKFIILLILESLLIAGLFMYVSSDTITTGYYNSVLTVDRTPKFFLVQLALITAIVAIGISMAGMIIFILLSHRIAGPLFRFEKILSQIESGDLTTRIDLRKTDQLTEMKGSLNAFIVSLDSRISRVKSGLEEARLLLERRADPASAEKLKKTLDLVRDEIEHFKVTSLKTSR